MPTSRFSPRISSLPRALVRRAPALIVLAAIAALAPAPATAQTPATEAFESLSFRELGPAIMGGRISDIAVVEADPANLFVGTATGGLWKSTNHGTTWEQVFDRYETSSVGDVTVFQANPNVVWVGTGEPQNRQSSPWGYGVYKSMDGGRTFQHLGLVETRHIARIVLHPTDPDVAYVAAMGHLWGPNPERGVYRTTDGGATWEQVLFVDENTGTIDLAMAPGDPHTLYAAMYQRQRTAWGYNGGGPGSGIYRTTDGGDTWEELTGGLPDADMGRIGLGTYPGDGNVVFAVVQAMGDGQGFYRTDDRGDTWEKLSDTNPRPMYYSQVWVDPMNPEKIFLAGANLNWTHDGGRTFDDDVAETVHSDHHAMWIDPSDPDHIYMGGDGGLSTSFDGGESWRMLDNLPLAQFYEIGFDMQDPYVVCGGLQDNGSWCSTTNTKTNLGIRNRDWYNINGGDGFYVRVDPQDPRIGFTESQGGSLSRIDFANGERVSVRPNPPEPMEGEAAERYRWNWNTPIHISHHDRSVIYAGSNKLMRSTDRGQSWEEASPDLTYAMDRDELEIMGRLPSEGYLSRNDGQSTFGTLTTIGESTLDANLIYTGADDGRVMRTRDGGATWDDLTDNVPGLPDNTYVSRVVPSAMDAGTVYATFDGHRSDDFAPYVYRSDDYGESWEAIADGLPDWSVNIIAEHPENGDLLFLGNEVGLYVSVDRGESWTKLGSNFPVVPVDDLAIHPRENDLIIGTHGRGVWLLEDLAPLEGLTADVMASAAHVFAPRRGRIWNEWSTQGWYTDAEFERPNPPEGIRIRYWMSGGGGMSVTDSQGMEGGGSGPSLAATQEAMDMARIVILDGQGNELRHMEGPTGHGIHQVLWDFRVDPPYAPDEEEDGGGFGRGAPDGYRVLPGTYTVRLEVAGATSEQPVQVELDPLVRISQADLMARQRLLMDAYALAAPVYQATQALQRLNEQVSGAGALAREAGDVPDEVSTALQEMRSELTRLSRGLNEANSGVRGASRVERAHAPPTEDQRQALERAWEAAPGLIRDLNRVITEDMPALNRLLNQHGVRPDPGETVAVPRRPGGM